MATTLIENGLLIDGNGGAPVPGGAVLVQDNRLQAVGRRQQMSLPAGCRRLDAQGGTILPGLIDTHVHLLFEGFGLEERLVKPFSLSYYEAIGHMKRTLDAGITTVRDAGGADLGLKRAVEQGLVPGPRMQLSITVLSTTGGHGDGWLPSGANISLFSEHPGRPGGIVDGPENVRLKVREVLRAGAEVIKVCATGGVLSPTDHPEFTQFSPEELAVMVQEGRYRRGVKVMAHAQGAEGIKNAVRAGIHSIEHGIYVDEEAIELMLAHGTYLVPTLLAPLAVLEAGQKTGRMPEWGIRKAEEVLESHQANIAAAYQAGVKIAMGTDAGVMPHGTNLRELGLMCQIGMDPMAAIVATTRTAAECLGWQGQVGTLEPGKLADVIVCRSNPLDDIRSLEDAGNIALVMKDGQVVKNLLA